MASDKRIHVRIHPSAKPGWATFLDSLPGAHDDKVMLIEEYMRASWPAIKAKLKGREIVEWECEFAKGVEFLLASRMHADTRVVTIFGVRRRNNP